ncbi:primase alpha helix C-terminal domain-containing protein [Staphylococcus saprophyticus]|uniref:primase alpha helix C-terminal domain-containing protein n=1 Tax=Staphylococcus saprophyticus TaxID=29385 RepID=UPI002DBBE0BE|nr:primase alpha helix C-terminal domain-containing protein [Staphylococcus saprophyticus]MEB5647594.1 primase alpha helix C-terminal domain-containing protein [Staphylococcus saprophyticus]
MSFEKIQLEYDTDVSVVEYENLDAGSFTQFTECTWNELINRYQTPKINQNKYSRNTAIYGDVSDGVDKYGNHKKKYREDKNVINRNVIVLDYDDINDLKTLHKAIRERLSDFAWFWHTSFSHKSDAPRIRLLIPLQKSINADEYRIFTKVIASKIGHKVDEGSFQPSRCMALPVKRAKDSVYIYRYNGAPIMDKSTLEKWCQVIGDKSKHNNVKLTFNKRNDEYWRNIALGTAEGNRNQALTSIIGLLLRRYVNDSLVYGLAYSWSKQCTPPIDDKEFNKTFESIYKRHYKL